MLYWLGIFLAGSAGGGGGGVGSVTILLAVSEKKLEKWAFFSF